MHSPLSATAATSISEGRAVDVVFLTLARNCAGSLGNYFHFLDLLKQDGLNIRCVLGENGSTDRTPQILARASAARDDIVVIDTSFMASCPTRLSAMAHGRQSLADYAKQEFPDAAYICVADADNVFRLVPGAGAFRGALNRLARDASLFGVSAGSHPYYYDLLALRCPPVFNKNMQTGIDRYKAHPLKYWHFFRTEAYPVQKMFTTPPVRLCVSAFNGICVYRSRDFYLGTYLSPSVEAVAEHVTLNEAIHSATGRYIWLDADLAVNMPAEHGPQGFAYFFYSRFLKLASKALGVD